MNIKRSHALVDPVDLETSGASPTVGDARTLHVERVELAALLAHQAAWADLCTRALEPNVFLAPGFVVPLLRHVATAPSFLLVWEEEGPVFFGRLVGLFALHLGGARTGFGAVARGLMHEQTTSGLPLIDRERAVETLAAALAWLGGRAGGRRAALVLPGITVDGPFHAALLAACDDRDVQVLATRQRAILRRPAANGAPLTLLASAKRRKERNRQNRRLSDVGRRSYTSARTVDDVAAATERFLVLEHRGWKGRRGTSLGADPALATFTRAMTRLLAEAGGCRIDAIEIDGRPVAMGIMLQAGDRAFFWKTCFDETFGAMSPGVQLARELTQVQLDEPSVAVTDSCAVADHPMIDRLWPHRMIVADLMIAVRPGPSRRFRLWARVERAGRALRRGAKAAYRGLRRLD